MLRENEIIKQEKIDKSLTPFLSVKIKVVSFLSIVVVFFIHSTFPEEPYEEFLLPVVVRKCTAGLFGPCAVPMFYLISGFLFFRGVEGLQTVLTKIKKRIRTLIIPFIIAALFYPTFFVTMELIPGVSGFIDRPSYIEMCRKMMPIEILSSLFYGASGGWPWAYHLWFMRDLIIIVFLSPVIYYVRKWLGYWIIALILVLYLLFPNQWFLYAMFWFVSGSMLLEKFDNIPRWIVFVLLMSFMVMAIYRLFLGEYYWRLFNVIEISMGLVSFWCIYDCITHNHLVFEGHSKLKLACQFTFFLYLYHEPFFHILVKAFILAIGKTSLGYTASIIIPPCLFVFIGVIIGSNLKIFFPRLYWVLTGGR